MPLTITFEDNWTATLSTFANSRYKTEGNTVFTHADQIESCLDDLSDLDNYYSLHSANVLQNAFEYKSFNDITQLHVIKLSLNNAGILCLKIAAPHPQSTDACLVGTFTLDPTMNILAVDKVESIQRKIPRLTLPNGKLPLATIAEDQCAKENISPNFKSNTPFKSDFWQQAESSHRTLPVSDDLLARLLAVQPSTSMPASNVQNTPFLGKLNQ